MSKKEIGIQANFHSSNTDNALHLNKIEMRSLKLEHERLQRDHKYHIKNGLRETKAIEQNLLELPDSTGCIGDRIFSDSKFQHLMIPIKREALLQDEPAPMKLRREITTISDLGTFRVGSPVATARTIKPPADPEVQRAEKIAACKAKDAVFRKRLDQFAIYKNMKKAPIFDIEKQISELNISKTVKDRDKKQIMQIVEFHRGYKPNPYRQESERLVSRVQKFCLEQGQYEIKQRRANAFGGRIFADHRDYFIENKT